MMTPRIAVPGHLYPIEGPLAAQGVAKDTHGNLFKLTF
jgi:hypothetical protein